jgi:hypothetical protein
MVPNRRSGAPAETSIRLVADVAGPGAPAAIAAELAAWVDASTRMRRFVEANGRKIRRKLREARDPETQRDVRAELLVAARLLGDRRIDIGYEVAGQGRGGPDFTVAVRGATQCNVEVTRRRGAADAAGIAEAVLAKLRQLPPSVPNVLVVGLEHPLTAPEINAAMLGVRARADIRDSATLARAGVRDPRGFYDRFLRLAAVIAWAEAADSPLRATAWANPSARIRLDRVALRAITAALAD